MMNVQCPACAARYRVPEKLLGKKAKCKKCGRPFELAPPPPPPDEGYDLLASLADGEVQERPPEAVAPAMPPGLVSDMAIPAVGGSPAEKVEERTGFATYLRDVGKSAVFFVCPGDLITFVVVCVIYLLLIPLQFGGCLGLVGTVVVMGWYMAFQLNVVCSASAGEDGLPNMTIEEPMEGIFLPLIKWIASRVAATVPFAIALVYFVLLDRMNVNLAFTHGWLALCGSYMEAFDSNQGGGALLGVLLLLSMTIWPMAVLVAAVGGARSLVRFDLMLMTMIKTLPAYLLVVMLAYAGVVAPAVLTALAALAMPGGEDDSVGLGTALGFVALMMVFQVYGSIFTMRVIGLYYHHFKRRFAWSWG